MEVAFEGFGRPLRNTIEAKPGIEKRVEIRAMR
jgi:hypothetical protein